MSDTQEFANEGKEDRCAVVLVLDKSWSMSEENKIGYLNDGVQVFRDELLKDPIASVRVEVAVVAFGGTVDVVNEFTTALDFQPQNLVAEGGTPLGGAICKALDMVEDRKAIYRSNGINYYRPWIWVMTDGQPTDDWQDCVNRARQAGKDRQAMVFALGIGDDANADVLKQISDPRPALKLNDEGFSFAEMFLWLSRSLGTVSRETAASDDQLDLEPVDSFGTVYP